MKKKIVALFFTLATVSLLVFSSPISARGGGDSSRPGNGQGDINHDHYGSSPQHEDGERPGWGYGDKNHDHYGYGYGNRDKDYK